MRQVFASAFAILLVAATAAAEEAKPGDPPSSSAKRTTMEKVHQALSADCFNKCWTLIDKKDRSAEDVENMILLANASLWHWKQRPDCKPQNLAIGYWQLSRVYALAEQYAMAKLFGEKCLKVSQQDRLSPFNVGYAYEALARAEFLHGDTAKAKDLLAKAAEQLAKVTDKEERGLLEADLGDLAKTVADKPGR